MREILVLENCSERRQVIAQALDECAVDFYDSIPQASSAILKKHFDLVVLDVSVPGEDQLKFLLEINAQPESRVPPVVVVSDKSDIKQKVLALNAGADDFVSMPFDPNEFKARAFNKIRKHESHLMHENHLRVGDLSLDVEKQQVWRVGYHSIDLTSLEFKLLLCFAKAPERVYTRNELLDMVWGKNIYVNDRTVDTHVGHLRKKLKSCKTRISTVFGSGYRLQISKENESSISQF